MVQKIIGVTELQRRFRSVIDDVTKGRVPYVLTRGSRAEAALVPYDDYQHLQALHEKEVGFELDRLLEKMRRGNANRSEDELRKDIRRARAEVRRSSR
jgi:prevent-host-death family protein